jgi:hypothetical protein
MSITAVFIHGYEAKNIFNADVTPFCFILSDKSLNIKAKSYKGRKKLKKMIHTIAMLQCRSCRKATVFCDWNVYQAQAFEEYHHLSMQIHKHDCVYPPCIFLTFHICSMLQWVLPMEKCYS